MIGDNLVFFKKIYEERDLLIKMERVVSGRSLNKSSKLINHSINNSVVVNIVVN